MTAASVKVLIRNHKVCRCPDYISIAAPHTLYLCEMVRRDNVLRGSGIGPLR